MMSILYKTSGMHIGNTRAQKLGGYAVEDQKQIATSSTRISYTRSAVILLQIVMVQCTSWDSSCKKSRVQFKTQRDLRDGSLFMGMTRSGKN